MDGYNGTAYFLKMPQDMIATEFATKVMNDKDFMCEVFTHIPDAMMEEGAAEKANPDAQGQMDKMFGWYCWPFAQAKGCIFTEDELMAECDRQFKALGGFGKIKFGVRMIETLGKASQRRGRYLQSKMGRLRTGGPFCSGISGKG